MNVQSLARRALLILAFGALLVPLTGCNKMLANFSLNQANKRVDEAKKYHAETHAPDELSKAQDAINQTVQLVNGQQMKEARIKGKEAATLAKDLLALSKERDAVALKSTANDWKGYMVLNEAQSEGADLYQKILETIEAGNKAFEKQSWEKAVANYNKAVEDARYLLQNLLTKSQSGLADVNAKLKELQEEGADEHYPEGISAAEDSINKITDMIEVKHAYRDALRTKDAALQKGDEDLRKTKEVKSDKLLREVENSLNKATQLGAELYATDSFNQVSRTFEDLLRLHYEGKYESVLKSAPNLIPKALDLIVETQRESARSRLAAVNQAITKLTDGKAKTYLPGKVEAIEEKYKAAQEKFNQATPEMYTETEKIAKEALEMEQAVLAEYDQLAQKEVANAKDQLSTAGSIFDKMVDIFSHPSPVQLSETDMMFEKQKEGLREEIRGRRDGAVLKLGRTDLMRGDKNFAGMIETAKQVVDESNQIVNDTFKVVSFNTINELSNEMTSYEINGGRENAKRDLDKAEQMLLETRAIHAEGRYRDALTKGAETKAQIAVLAQEIGRVANAKIADLDTAIKLAEEMRAGKYKPEDIAQGQQIKAAAAESLQNANLQDAIKFAEKGTQIVNEAAKTSIRRWTEDEMRRTELRLAQAREAGAEYYASAQLNEAVGLYQTTNSLYEAGDYEKAQVTGAKAAAAADSALYAQVIKAEDEIAAAKRFDAWRYENERLAQSIINVKYARDFMNRGDYAEARIHAEHAYQTAAEVTVAAKKASFNDRLISLNDKVEAAARQGAGYYQVKDLSAIVGELNRLATEFDPAGYEESAQKIELLEAQLAGLVEMTPNVLQELVDHMNRTLADLEGRGARAEQPDLVAEAVLKIKYTQLDYTAQKYRPSFENARAGIKILNEIDLRLDERDYDLKLSAYFTTLARSVDKFSSVLNMGSPVLTRLAQGPTGRMQAVSILSTGNPTDFRQELSDLMAEVSLLEPPATRRPQHQATMEMLETAKASAAGFEKLLILDQYDQATAKKIIEDAYLQFRSARARQREIQDSLESPQTRAELPGIRRAIVQNP